MPMTEGYNNPQDYMRQASKDQGEINNFTHMFADANGPASNEIMSPAYLSKLDDDDLVSEGLKSYLG